MSGINLIPIMLVGLLGSVHCVGMCGGIVGALSVASGRATGSVSGSASGSGGRRIPIAVAGTAAASTRIMNAPLSSTLSNTLSDTLRVVAYNAGRIASYASAGAVAGGVASSLRSLWALSSLQAVGYWLANLMLIALGLYLMDAWRGLAHLEAAGQLVWRRVQPLTKRLLPMDSPGKAFLLGAAWGWLPCGMVYSVLLTAMLSGSALAGASIMAAFGLGTLPMLLAMGMLGTRLRAWTRRRQVRVASGVVILLFGMMGLWRATQGMAPGWIDAICASLPMNGAMQGHVDDFPAMPTGWLAGGHG